MKMQVLERITGYPIVEVIPERGEFSAFQALVEVRFFGWDTDGRKIYKPAIVPNVQFCEQSASSINEWGDIFKAAALIANMDASVMFLAVGCDAKINEIWRLVTEARTQLAQHPAPAATDGAQ